MSGWLCACDLRFSRKHKYERHTCDLKPLRGDPSDPEYDTGGPSSWRNQAGSPQQPVGLPGCVTTDTVDRDPPPPLDELGDGADARMREGSADGAGGEDVSPGRLPDTDTREGNQGGSVGEVASPARLPDMDTREGDEDGTGGEGASPALHHDMDTREGNEDGTGGEDDSPALLPDLDTRDGNAEGAGGEDASPALSPCLLSQIDAGFDEEGGNYPSSASDGSVASDDGVNGSDPDGDGPTPSSPEPGSGPEPLAATNSGIPNLCDLHEDNGGDIWEGGAENLKFNTKAEDSPFFPFVNYSQNVLFNFQANHMLSRTVFTAMLTMLRGSHEGNGFDVSELAGVDADHFFARTREYLPLLEVRKVVVPCAVSAGEDKTATVLHIPINLLLDRQLRSSLSVETFLAHPGGKVMRDEEAEVNGLRSEHVFSGPVRPRGNSRRSNMHGLLARTSPFFGYDGIVGAATSRMVHVNDVAMCVVTGDAVATPCRVLGIFWDEEESLLLVSVRRFRTGGEVHAGNGRPEAGNRNGLLRLWEEEGDGSGLSLPAKAVLDLCQIYTAEDVESCVHLLRWAEGADSQWEPCVGEGFVRKDKKSGKRKADAAAYPPFLVFSTPWSKEGTPDEMLYSTRKEGFHQNNEGLPFVGAPIVYFIDGFNVNGMKTKHSVGGSYVGFGWNSQSLQRRRDQTHVISVASPKACCEGETELQCKVLGLLQRGCIATVALPGPSGESMLQEAFLRGGPIMFDGDSPQRAAMLFCKHPNRSTRHPCPYCMVKQTDENEGGELGDPAFDVAGQRRSKKQISEGRAELLGLEPWPARQAKRSVEIGVVPPDSNGMVEPLYQLMDIDPLAHVPVEKLHADALGVQGFSQAFFIGLLNTNGRQVISSVVRQRSTLYPVGTHPLTDIVNNYSSLTGSHKWLLASIMLLVFRPVLHNASTLRSYVKRRELNLLLEKWTGVEAVLCQLRKLMQVASALSFAVRAPSFNDKEVDGVHLRARDVVGVFKELMGAVGVRPVVHSVLHYKEAILNHGIVPDASSGEFAHQLNKRTNKNSSGRHPEGHYMRAANTTSALNALANGLPWVATKYNRSINQHVQVTLQPGPACVRVLQALRAENGGLGSHPPDRGAEGHPTQAALRGQFPGSASWSSSLWDSSDAPVEAGGWVCRLKSGHMRPDREGLLEAYSVAYGCGRAPGEGVCSNTRCPHCWTNPMTLDVADITCSRFKHGASLESSSGLGRWKGGNVKAAATGPRDAWALGDGGGEDVEVWKTFPPPLSDSAPVSVQKLSMVRILYFFDHEGNRHGESGLRPKTSWVLAFDYAAAGRRYHRMVDPATQHPVMVLRGRGRPLVYPAAAIRRHVHLSHLCPAENACASGVSARADRGVDREWVCGPAPVSGGGASGGGQVWRHRFRLASPGQSLDRYLLNEHHHSLNRDSFL